MSRHDLTDREWKAIRVYLPKERSGKRGRPWNDHRVTLTAFSGSFVWGPRGVICQNAFVNGRRFTTDSGVGRLRESGIAFGATCCVG